MVAIIGKFNRYNLQSQWVWCVNIKCSLSPYFYRKILSHNLLVELTQKLHIMLHKIRLRCVHWDVGAVENDEKNRNTFV